MKKVIKMIDQYIEVTKTLAIQVVADEVADWITAKEDMEIGLEYVSKGDRYFFHEGELYTEADDVETLLGLAGYEVEYMLDDEYDTTDEGYYDVANMQWMK